MLNWYWQFENTQLGNLYNKIVLELILVMSNQTKSVGIE